MFLTLSGHLSLLSIAPDRSSRLYPVSAQSCCIYVLGGRPAFARPFEEVLMILLLTSSSLLLQQCLACLVRLTLIVFVMGGRRPNSCCFVGCCLQDLFNAAHSFLVQCIYIYIYIHECVCVCVCIIIIIIKSCRQQGYP